MTKLGRSPIAGAGLHPGFALGGSVGQLMASFDWTRTSMGWPGRWPQSLWSAVSICLPSRFPIVIFWGPDLALLYNDAYVPMLGDKHPRSLGQPAEQCWHELWPTIGPMLDGVMSRGNATWSNDLLLEMNRHGFREEAYFTFSYSPIQAESGGVGGVFCAVQETTARVLERRRLNTLRELGRPPAGQASVEAACAAAAQTLASNPMDLPFFGLYVVPRQGDPPQLVGWSSERPESMPDPGVPLTDRGELAWDLTGIAKAGQPQLVQTFRDVVPGSSADSTPLQAFVLPVGQRSEDHDAVVLVAGLSPKLAFDDEYRTFLELAQAQIARSIAEATAYADERRRADTLAALDRAKTQFFSNVSHEFRTPLTLMLGPLDELLTNGSVDPEDRAQLEVARRNAERLLKLVNTLLDFSRLEAGRMTADFEPLDLAAVTADLASNFRSAFQRANLDFSVDCRKLSQAVFVDREMWEKVVLNLISNAFKFTHAGGVRISMQDYEDGVVFEVHDSGTGIPADAVPHLFERFYRVAGSRSRTHEGTGIGLALVNEIVKLHGGSIAVESQPDLGSTFRIRLPYGFRHLPQEGLRLPRAKISAAVSAPAYVHEAFGWLPDGAPQNNGGPKSVSAEPAGEKGRVLVVDDNSDVRAYLRHLLDGLWEVELASNGAAALRMARRSPPDLILADVMMPEMDGFDLLRELRADAQLKGIPFVMLSARAGTEAAVDGLDAGADDYIVKPFTSRELIARIRTNLELARARREIALARENVHLAANDRARLAILNEAAHELGTPLALIRGYVSLLSDGSLAEQPELLTEAYRVLSERAEVMSSVLLRAIDNARDQVGDSDRQ